MENTKIKFRGFSKQLNHWVYGFYHEVEAEGKVYGYIFWQGHTTPIEIESVGQFTGLKDNKGVEIYELDYLRDNNQAPCTKKEYWNPIYEVGTKLFGFDLKHLGGGKKTNWWLPLTNWNQMNIVGNSYEDTEMKWLQKTL